MVRVHLPQPRLQGEKEQDMPEQKYTDEQVERMFTYIPPKPGQPEKYNEIRESAKAMALKINQLCPESSQKEAAILLLTQANMMANASIAINES